MNNKNSIKNESNKQIIKAVKQLMKAVIKTKRKQ